MHGRAWIVLLAAAAHAQVPIDADRGARLLAAHAPHAGEVALRGELTPLRPALNFGLRFQAGFVLSLPLNQWRGAGHSLRILLAVTPQDGGHRTVYLASRYLLPEIPPTRMWGLVGGGYLLGEGRYTTDATVLDETGRVFRATWQSTAGRGRGNQRMPVNLPPNTVAQFSLFRHAAPTTSAPRAPAIERLTVLLDAAPANPRQAQLQGADAVKLLDAVSSLVERIPARNVRVVAFNLDQQKEIFRQDRFGAAGFQRLARALFGLQLATVGVTVLQNPAGAAGLLTSLVKQEIDAPDRADLVLFLGPRLHSRVKLPPDAVALPAGDAPGFFYIAIDRPVRHFFPSIAGVDASRRASGISDPPLGPPLVLPGGVFGEPLGADVISSLIGRLKGKTEVVVTPSDFAKAIARIVP
ncbi:MAG: hypothetical protein ACLQVN_10380 [Bryobacteraceae bacterium]